MRQLRNEKGTTLVEVLVGFTILLLVFAMFQYAVQGSLKLLDRARETDKTVTQDDKDFYEKKSNRSLIDDENITIEDSSGNTISVPGKLYQQEDSKRYYWEVGDSSQ